MTSTFVGQASLCRYTAKVGNIFFWFQMFRTTSDTVHTMYTFPQAMVESWCSMRHWRHITGVHYKAVSFCIYIWIQEVFTVSRQFVTFGSTASAKDTFCVHNEFFEVCSGLTSTSFSCKFWFYENPRSYFFQAANFCFPINY